MTGYLRQPPPHSGATIRKARQQHHRTLQQVAQAADLSVSSLSQIERNLLTPSVGTLKRIADALHIPAGKLMFAPDARSTRSTDRRASQGSAQACFVPAIVDQLRVADAGPAPPLVATVAGGRGRRGKRSGAYSRGRGCRRRAEGTAFASRSAARGMSSTRATASISAASCRIAGAIAANASRRRSGSVRRRRFEQSIALMEHACLGAMMGYGGRARAPWATRFS